VTVLILDDCEHICRSLQRWLGGLGIPVIAVTTREEAIERCNGDIRATLVDYDLGASDPTGGALFFEHLDEVKSGALRILRTGNNTAEVRLLAARYRAVWMEKGESNERLLDLLAIVGIREAVRESDRVCDDNIVAACAVWRSRYGLSTMEAAVLREACLRGATRTSVADELKLAPDTVKSHTRNLLAKTLDDNLAAAVARLLREIVGSGMSIRPDV
jgi:FixJ family two-component response regulator